MKKIDGRPQNGGRIYIEKGGVSPLASGKTPVPPKAGTGVPSAPATSPPVASGGSGGGPGRDKK